MLYIFAALAGLVTGLFLRGTLTNFLNMNIRHKWAFISALVIQLSFQILNMKDILKFTEYGLYVQTLVFILLLTGFWLNRQYLGHLTTGLGCALNAAVMLANGGKMPVESQLVEKVIENKELVNALLSDGKHTLVVKSTRLLPLTDYIHLPGFLGIGMRIVSIGDLVIVLGIFILVLELTIGSKFGLSRRGKDKLINRNIE